MARKKTTGDTTDVKSFDEMIRQVVDDCVRARLDDYADRPFTRANRAWWAPTVKLHLAAWRELHAEGHPGAVGVGRERAITKEASDYYVAKHAIRKAPPAPVSATRDVDAEAHALLGLRRVG